LPTQSGFLEFPVQSLSVPQATHLPLGTSQTGVAARFLQWSSDVHAWHEKFPSTARRQSGFVGSAQPCSVVGWQGLQRVVSIQKARLRSVVHSAFDAQPRHSVEAPSQIGVVGVTQSVADVAQPPHEPLGVQTSAPPQLFGDDEQALHAIVAESQIGVLPLHPEFPFAGSHATHFPATHSLLPSVRVAQSVASRHSTHAGSAVPDWAQNRSGPVPEQARFVAGSHTHVRSSHDLASVDGHGFPQASHSSTDVFSQRAPWVEGQQSSSAAQPSCVFTSQAAGGDMWSAPPSTPMPPAPPEPASIEPPMPASTFAPPEPPDPPGPLPPALTRPPVPAPPEPGAPP
jgi:hypothetical protein